MNKKYLKRKLRLERKHSAHMSNLYSDEYIRHWKTRREVAAMKDIIVDSHAMLLTVLEARNKNSE